MTIERRIRRVCKQCDTTITYFQLVSTNNFGSPFASGLGSGEPNKTCGCGSSDFRYCDVDDPIVLRSVHDFDFPPEVLSIFRKGDIYYIGDLISLSESDILALPSVTESQLGEIRQVLDSIDLCLGAELDWPPPGFK